MSNETAESTPAKPKRKTHRGRRSAPKAAAKRAARPQYTDEMARREAADTIAATARGKDENGPVAEGYRRVIVDLRAKDFAHIERVLPQYEAEMRRKMTAGQVIDLIVRRAIMLDPSRYAGNATQPVVG